MARTLTAKKRDALLKAAIEIFKEKTYGEVTVREIVTRAGSSPATFYRYFETKERIYEEILDTFATRYLEAWGSVYPLFSENIKDSESALNTVATALQKMFEFYRDNRDLAGVIFRRIVSVDDRFADHGRTLGELTLEQLENVVGTLRSAGLGMDLEPRVGAAVTIGAVFSVALECIVQEQRDDVDSLVEQLMGVLKNGLLNSR